MRPREVTVLCYVDDGHPESRDYDDNHRVLRLAVPATAPAPGGRRRPLGDRAPAWHAWWRRLRDRWLPKFA